MRILRHNVNSFKFHNVGQGLFYTGSLLNGNYNFVFDCGATKGNKHHLDNAIKEYIASTLRKGNKSYINMVVISHLHTDHYSGLIELARWAEIKDIYLPCLPDDPNLAKLILAYSIFCESDEVDRNDMGDELILYDFMLRLYGLGGGYEYSREVYDNPLQNIKNIHIMDKNEDVENYIDYWCFELYNKQFDNAVIKDLADKLDAYIIKSNQANARFFVCDGPSKIDEIAKAYEEVFGKKNHHRLSGGLNISSCMLVHYPLHHGKVKRIKYTILGSKQKPMVRYLLRNGGARTVTVLTGDAIDFDKYPGFVNSVNEQEVFCLQVPHHGSKYNWNSLKKSKLQLMRNTHYVLSFGMGNNHSHPSTSVLDDLVNNFKKHYCVTQYSTFEYNIVSEPSIITKLTIIID